MEIEPICFLIKLFKYLLYGVLGLNTKGCEFYFHRFWYNTTICLHYAELCDLLCKTESCVLHYVEHKITTMFFEVYQA
jgi:hypothetical protein